VTWADRNRAGFVFADERLWLPKKPDQIDLPQAAIDACFLKR